MMAGEARQAAADYISRGWAVVPIPARQKRPLSPGWPDLRIRADELHQWFADSANVGVILGEASNGLIDVDLDHPRAVELADSFLPHTPCVFGRASKRASHRLFRVSESMSTRKWASRTDGMIVELRSTGGQTVFPGSIHPTGEAVEWHEAGEPALIAPEAIIAACEALATAVKHELGEAANSGSALGYLHPAEPRGTTAYAATALAREVETVRRTGTGSRNTTLNTAAFNLGQLIAGGELDRDEVERSLLDAAVSTGLAAGEAKKTIASGIKGGSDHPRARPARTPTQIDTDVDLGGLIVPKTQAAAGVWEGLEVVTADRLVQDYRDLRPTVVTGLLREGEVMNVVAAPKVGKSYLVHSLAASIAKGEHWLMDGFRCSRGRVLICDWELHHATLAHRLRRALGNDIATAGPEIDVQAFRGRAIDITMLRSMPCLREHGAYRLIVIDALYRALPPGVEENSNDGMTSVYNAADALAEQTGAAVVLVHHTSKGAQDGKSVTDVGSGAGAQSRAADTHLVLRRHAQDGIIVAEAVTRSFRAPEPFCLEWQDPGWKLALSYDPKDLWTPTLERKREKEKGQVVEAEKPKAAEWTPERFAREVVGDAKSIRDEILVRSQQMGLVEHVASKLLRRAESAGVVLRITGAFNSPHRFSVNPNYEGDL